MERKVDWLRAAEQFDDLMHHPMPWGPMRACSQEMLDPIGVWLYSDYGHAVIVCCLMAAMTPDERRAIGVRG